MKALKYALAGFAVLVLIIGAGVAYLLATFDPRDYEPRITAMVKEQTGRNLRIGGEFSLSFWPDIGVRLGAVSLSERDSEEAFVDAETVRFTVKLAPLFSRQLIADDLLVRGAHVRITRFADGRLNIDDLFRGGGPTPVFDVGRIKVERSTVSYRNLASRESYELTALAFETGRIASVAVTPLKLSFVLRNDAGTVDMTTSLQGRLSIDLVRRVYSIHEASVDLKGRFAGFEDFSAALKGNVAARAAERELDATSIAIVSNGRFRREQIEASAQAPKLSWSAGSLVIESAGATLNTTGAAGQAHVVMTSPSIVVDAQSVTAEAATVEVDASRGANAVNVSMTSAVQVQTSTGTLILAKLASKARVHGAGLPANGLTGVLAGHARVDFGDEVVRASLAGTVSGSRVKADLTATGFAAPAYRFAVELDQLDVDRFSSAHRQRAAGGTAFDISSLSKLPATGTLHIGTLTTGGLKAHNVKVSLKP